MQIALQVLGFLVLSLIGLAATIGAVAFHVAVIVYLAVVLTGLALIGVVTFVVARDHRH